MKKEMDTTVGLEKLIQFKKEIPEKYHEDINHIGWYFYSVLLTYEEKMLEENKVKKEIKMKKKRCLFTRMLRNLLCFFMKNRRCCNPTHINGIPVTTKLQKRTIKTFKKKPSVIRKKRTTTTLLPKVAKSVSKKKKTIKKKK